jgi:hypothetical protein
MENSLPSAYLASKSTNTVLHNMEMCTENEAKCMETA